MHILEAMWITIHIGFNTGPMQDFWIQITVWIEDFLQYFLFKKIAIF